MNLHYEDGTASESGSELDSEPEFENDPPTSLETIGDIDSTDSKEEDSDNSSLPAERANPAIMTARAYQMEMLEESLKQNIIVTMDTGSGKTQVAVLRIQAELARSKKLIWFLAPTVALCDQQLERIEEQIPSSIWDAFLQNVGVVVSTPEVLFRACQHGFVKISALSLLVIDEAHNCKGKSPGSRLMQEIYRPAKERGVEVPHILGLTASPVISSNLRDLEALEYTLDAICKSPKRHREELVSFVNLPQMSIVSYGAEEDIDFTPAMARLHKAKQGMDITQDPTVLRLRADRTERGREKLKNAVLKQDTFAQQKMGSFCHASKELRRQLGPWAADYYIHKVITDFLADNDKPNDVSGLDKRYDPDLRYLADIFRKVQCQRPAAEPTALSVKAQKLVEMLASYEGDLRGIVFVTERTTVAILATLLRRHPLLSGWLKVGTMVGMSSHHSKKHDFLEPSHGDIDATLRDFRSGKLDLLVATSVLEEGIDVPACNLVVCYEKPVTLKVFIQRRGRARMRVSRLIMLLDNDSTDVAHEWMQLEKQMKAKYEDDKRQLQIIQAIEEEEHPDYPVLEVEGEDGHLARLTIDDARQHLEHFCATLSCAKFVDFSPWYIVRMVGTVQDPKSPDARFMATVQLPVSLPPELRQAESIRIWQSERNAFKDAAFQAYVALYRADLLNDYLLPLREWDIFKDIRARASFTTVREQLDPWPGVALAWETQKELNRHILRFAEVGGSQQTNFELILPVPIPELPELTFYWDSTAAWTMSMGESRGYKAIGAPVSNDVGTLVTMAFGHRGDRFADMGKRHMVCLVSNDLQLSPQGIASEDLNPSMFPSLLQESHLIRDPNNYNHPFFFSELLPMKPPDEHVRKRHKGIVEYPEDTPWVAVRDWPKKAGYFKRPKAQPQQPGGLKLYNRILPAEVVKVDAIPAIYARFGLLYPSLLHALEVHLVAKELRDNRLESLELADLSMVTTAICTLGARMHVNYERIEFLGDCILKLSAASNCLAHHPDWPEGYLSRMKDGFVANSKLAQAALDFGLDRYIITKPLTLQGWKPMYVEDHLQASESITATREMSTKTLADVVEALVGASFLDGGLPKALKCLSLFMPKGKWQGIDRTREALYKATPENMALPPTMEHLEGLIGYTFTNKALLIEAMTHASYNVPGTHASLERLEFFGDSVVEYLVVRRLFAVSHPEPLPHWKMHLIRNALINSDIMAFLVMEASIRVERKDVLADDPKRIEIESMEVELPLWSFMRYHSSEISSHQKKTLKRFMTMREPIREAMEKGVRYPWALLARLQAQKFYSDLFESLLGSIYVDSGSFDVCDQFLERIGLLPYLGRIVRNEVNCLHPKEELGKLAVAETVEYVVECHEAKEEEEEEWDDEVTSGKKTFSCKVLIGQHVAAEVDGGVSREEAKTRAAEKVIGLYEGNGGMWWW